MPLDSPNPFADAKGPTLADVIAAIETVTDCTPRERREICSALRSLAKWFDLPPSAMPANMQYIRHRLVRFHPLQGGISKRRLQNVRSLTSKAFRVAGLATRSRSYLCPLTPEWSALCAKLPNGYASWGLSRFMHYCSAQRIAPTEVTDAVFDEFKRALVEESLVAHPLRDHQTACRLWNHMRLEITGWPDVSVTVPRYQLTYGIDWEQLHPRLLEEIEAYFAKLENPDLFDSDGPTRPLSPRSLKTMRGNVGRYLGALEQSGVDIGELTSLSQIVDLSHFKRAMEWLWRRNGEKPSQGLRGIVWTIRCIAIKWCKVDEKTAAGYRAIIRKLRTDQNGLSDKNDALLQQFDNPDLERRFLMVPLAIWEIVHRQHNELGAHRAARLAQVAVAIEILQFAPMRARNLLELTMEDHLNFYMVGDAEAVHITIPAEAVKNRERLSFTLPAEVSQRVKTYLDRHRPLLAMGPNRHLFPGRDDSHKDQSCLSRQITRAVWEHAGVRVTPHQFRHIAAKLLLDANPGAYELVRKLLGHKSTSMVYECYSGRETKAAGRIYNDVVLGGRGNDER